MKNSSELIDSKKDAIAVEIAKRIEKYKEFRWIKCVHIAMSASWWNKEYTAEELQGLDIDAITQQVFAEIDSGELE